MSDAKHAQMAVKLDGSDDPYFLPSTTEVGTTFDVGPVQFVLEEKSLSFDRSRSPSFSATGHARQVTHTR